MENESKQTNQEKIDYAAKELAYLLIEIIEHNRKLNGKAVKVKTKDEKSN